MIIPFPEELQPSNGEDWTVYLGGIDDETGDDIDFTGADIYAEVWDMNDCKKILSASTADIIVNNGTIISIPWSYANYMNAVLPGTYTLKVVFVLNGVRRELLNSTFKVDSGIIDT